jgi:quercetin dioxygenase-like cupin family protein
MFGTRLACGILAAGMVAAATACAPTSERAIGRPLIAQVSSPPSEKLSTLFREALPNVRGRTFTSAIVAFPPGARAVPHRHGDAFVFAYVLDGTVRSELEGQPIRTYGKGEFWVEQPGAHHVVTRNPSQAEAARLLVLFVSHTGDELKVDDPRR